MLLAASFAVLSLRAETYSGPGPDPACDGTSLTIEYKDKNPVALEYAIFGSALLTVEKYRAAANGAWDVVVEMYTVTRNDAGDPQQKLKTSYRFLSTDAKQGAKAAKGLKAEGFDWSKEPARLLEYFKTHRKQFEKI
jgi:hypothetical protein